MTPPRGYLIAVDAGQESLGYVALVRDDAGSHLVTYGAAGEPQSRPLDGDTVFEIGSITKAFTALLLADTVARGEVKLTEPVEKYLPPEGRPKSFDNKPISPLDLVTYTSGLPSLPTNFRPRDKENPFADYTVEQLYKFLSEYMPRYYPGSHYEYANLGFGLLGHVLALQAGRGYEELVVSRICGPLGLSDTRITLTPAMREQLAQGHDKSLHPVPGWDLPTLTGAGALRSTANDLMRFLDTCKGPRKTDLTPAFQSLLEVRRQTDKNGVYAAAGWFVETAHNDELVVKDGGTGGYASFIGYSARTGMAAVLLSNTGYLAPPVIANWSTTPGLGRYLLSPNFLIAGAAPASADRPDETERLFGALSADAEVCSDRDAEERAIDGAGHRSGRVRGLSRERHPVLLPGGGCADHLRAGA